MRLKSQLEALKDQEQRWKDETPMKITPPQPKPLQKPVIEKPPSTFAEKLEARAKRTLKVLNSSNLAVHSRKTPKPPQDSETQLQPLSPTDPGPLFPIRDNYVNNPTSLQSNVLINDSGRNPTVSNFLGQNIVIAEG